MLGEISLNAGDGTILSAVVLTLLQQAGSAPCLMHTASPCTVTSGFGQSMQKELRGVLYLIAAGWLLSIAVSMQHPYVAWRHSPS